MTDFVFTGPDGQKYKVTGPEGATSEQAFEMLKRSNPDIIKPAAAAAASGIGDFFKSIPRGVVSGLSAAGSALGQATSLEMGQPEQAAEIPGPEQTTDIVAGGLPKPKGTAGRYGASVGEALGNPASWVGPGGVVAKTAANVLGGAGAQAGEDLTGSPVGRFAGGVVGAAAPRAALRTISPNEVPAIRQPHIDELRTHGVEPMAGDVTGSRRIRYLEEMGEHVGGGGAYSANKERVGRQFTRAVNQAMGEGADLATPEVINRARDRLGQVFEQAAQDLPIRFEPGLRNDFSQIMQDLRSEGLPADTVNRVMRQMINIIDAFQPVRSRAATPTYRLSGAGYQGLTRADTPLARAMNDADPNIAYYAGRIRTALDDSLERNVQTAVRNAFSRGRAGGPSQANAIAMAQSLEALQEARRQWYTMMVISKSVAGPGEAAAEGLVSPQKLRQNLTNSPDNKLAYAAARTDLHRLARAGNAIMTPEKSSGTAERAWAHMLPAGIGHALTGGAVGAGAGSAAGGPAGAIAGTVAGAVAPGVAGRAVNSRPVQRWLQNQAVAPYLDQTPTLPWSMLRGGVDALAPNDGDALAR